MASIFEYITNRAWNKSILSPEGTQQSDDLEAEPNTAAKNAKARQTPMRVLCLSPCRTSELSLGEALKILGYRPFGMAENTRNPKLMFGAWKQAVDAKYHHGPGKPWGRNEFDWMMGEYDACIGVPTCFFVEELLEAYPDAKVILSKRSPANWAESMRVAAGQMMTWPLWNVLSRYDSAFSGPVIDLVRSQMAIMCGWPQNDFSRTGHSAKWFEKTQNNIKELGKGRLLEWRVEEDGWEPLCEFLDKPVPKGTSFPALKEDDDDKSIVRFQKFMWWIGITRVTTKFALVFIGLPSLVWFTWTSRDSLQSTATSLVNRIL